MCADREDSCAPGPLSLSMLYASGIRVACVAQRAKFHDEEGKCYESVNTKRAESRMAVVCESHEEAQEERQAICSLSQGQ